MKHTIFINKYTQIQDHVSQCIPEESKFIKLDEISVLVELPKFKNRVEVLTCCREALGEKKEILIQPVISYTETSSSIEVTVPQMKRFFQKQ